MPSFAIEVPGEANPLSEHQLARTLAAAASSDPTQIRSGTQQLQQWEKSQGFYKLLHGAYLDHSLSLEVRYLAIIQLKNGIDKYWRSTAMNSLSNDDKTAIRDRLLIGAVNENDDRLAIQNALVIAKVARLDYPNAWPDALSSLVTALRSQLPPLQLARTLLVLLHIIKELSTARLQRQRRNLTSAAPEIVQVLATLYLSTVQSWRNSLDSSESAISMHLSLMTLKVLRRLLIAGYDNPNHESEVVSFWDVSQNHLGDFINLAKASGGESSALIKKHMIQLAKLHHRMSTDHPIGYVLLPNSIQLTKAYWNFVKEYAEDFRSNGAMTAKWNNNVDSGTNQINQTDDRSNEKLALKGLLILRASVKMVHNPTKTIKYRSPEEKVEQKHATQMLRDELLTEYFAYEVMNNIVTSFFIFQNVELQEWQSDPEEWERREEGSGEDWEFSIRSCSEKLFLDLMINYKILIEPLLQAFQQVATTQNEDVLRKDCVYTAIGLAAPVLNTHLNFDAFLANVLVAEVQKQLPGFSIIRRRAAILLAQWITVSIAEETRPLVYQIFQHLLDKRDGLNDLVVRVTAGRQFKQICDAWEFEAKQFLPYADPILSALMKLIEEVDLSETKMALLNTISVAVERLDHHISPFAERIVAMLPKLWEESGEEHLMKQAILTIFARLVNAMKAESLPLHPLVFPIICGAVAPGSETQIYLLDDAMDLWAAILVQTPETASDDLLAMVPFLYSIFELGTENFRRAIEIAESYLILSPAYILLDDIRVPFFAALSQVFDPLKPEAKESICNLLEMSIRAADTLGGDRAVRHLFANPTDDDLIFKILLGLKSCATPKASARALKYDSFIDVVAETGFFCVLAQFILSSLDGFSELCLQFSFKTEEKPGLDTVMEWLLEEWFSHLDNVGDPSRRKLMCLALTRLLDTNQPWILARLQSLMTFWTDIITELRGEAEDQDTIENSVASKMNDSLVMKASSPTPGDEPETPEDIRRRRLTYANVVHTINLPHFIKAKLESCIAVCGGEQTFQNEWLVNVDRDVLDAFLRLGIMG